MQDCDLLDSAEEPHPISLSETRGAVAPPAPLVLTALLAVNFHEVPPELTPIAVYAWLDAHKKQT